MILHPALLTAKAGNFVELVKPRITALVIFTTGMGLWLAPAHPQPGIVFWSLLGTVLLVGSANALNMYIERDVDALMQRTMNRPLPAKRLSPRVALWFGIVLASVAVAILSFKVNLLTGLLGLVAFVSYVLFYTPLKQKSYVALLIGAVPGAMPPLMGWTAATGSIGMGGIILFLILFLWQVPHFLAIALVYQEEYERAGIKILPSEKGEIQTKHYLVRYLAALVAVSLYPVWLGVSGAIYFWTALSLGLLFFGLGCYGLKPSAGRKWARLFFLASVIYLPVLFFVLVIGSRTS